MAHYFKTILSFSWLLLLSSSVSASPDAFTLQGQIIKPDGSKLEAASVAFSVQIFSPAPDNCLLYEEQFPTVNMTGSRGLFNLTVGSGTRVGGDFEDTSTLSGVMNNASDALTPTTCLSGGPNYTPGGSDNRLLRLTFDDGSGAVTLAQDHIINSVPFAQYAKSVEGLGAVDLVKVNIGTAALSQANLETIFAVPTDVTDLRALIDGTSGDYLLSAPAASVGFNNQRITDVANPTAATDAANKNYVDSNLGGNTVATGSLGAVETGQVLTWDGNQWVSQALSASGDVNNGGNSFSGLMTLGTNDAFGLVLETNNTPAVTIDASQGISMAAGLGVTGGINAGGDINLLAESELRFQDDAGGEYVGLKAPIGVTSYVMELPPAVGTTGQVLELDGSGNLQWTSNAAGITSLNSETGETQTFAAGTAGTDFAISSAGGVHTFNIPTASGTNRGALASADWTIFNNKLNSSLNDGQILLGNVGNTATAVTVGGDVGMTNAGVVTVQKLQNRDVAATLPTDAQVLKWNNGSSAWEPAADLVLTEVQVDGFASNNGYAADADVLKRDGSVALTGNVSAGSNKITNLGTPTLAADATTKAYVDGEVTTINTSIAGRVADTGDVMTGDLVMDNETQVHFREATGNGSNYVGFKAPALLAADVTWTLPDSVGTANQVLRNSGTPGILEWATTATGTGDFLANGSIPMTGSLNTAENSIIGGVDALDNLTLEATTNASKGDILFAPSGGNVGIGTSNSRANLDILSTDSELRVGTINNSGSTSSLLSFRKALDDGSGGPAIVVDNNRLGQLSGQGYDGSAYIEAAKLMFAVDGAPAAGDMPGEVRFFTRPQGGGASLQRIVVKADGDLGIGTAVPDDTALIDMVSTTKGALIPRMTTAQRDAIASPAEGLQVYNTSTNQLNYHNGSSWQALGVAGAGLTSLNAQTGSSQTFAAGTAGTDFGISSAGNVHTFNIPTATGTNRGALASADWTAFSSKLTSVLSDGQVLVGNGSNVATGVTLSGDVSITNAGVVIVEQLQGRDVAATQPIDTQVLKWNNGSSTWAPGNDLVLTEVQVDGFTNNNGYAAAADVVARAGDTMTGNLNLGDQYLSNDGGDEGLRIDDSGSIGVGTTAPVTKLDVEGRITSGPIDATSGNTGSIVLEELSGTGGNSVGLRAPDVLAADLLWTLPDSLGAANQILRTSATPGILEWATPTTGIGDFLADGTVAMTGNLRTGGQWISNDGDSEGLFVDSDGKVGLGLVSSPEANLHILTNDATARIRIENRDSDATGNNFPGIENYNYMGSTNFFGHPVVNLRNARGTSSAAVALLDGDTLGVIEFEGVHNTSNGDTVAAQIRGVAAENFTNTATGSDLIFRTASLGADTLTDKMLISADGFVGIGTDSPNSKLDVDGALSLREMAAPAPSPADQGRIYFDTMANKFRVSENNGAYVDLVSAGGGGDITSIITSTGSGLTGGVASGDSTLQVVVDGTSLEINSNTIQVRANGISNSMIAAGLDAGKLTTGLLSADRIQDGTLPGLKIANNGIGTNQIANLAVTNAKLANDIDASKITTGFLDSARINNLAITEARLAVSAVSTDKIANTAVTNAKLAADGFDIAKFTVGTLDSARLDTGTNADDIVKLDGSARLPAVDGSLLTGVTGLDSTKLPLAGGTMTGNLNLGGQYLSNDGGNEGLRISDSGNVGIGTAVPGRPLDVWGVAQVNSDITGTPGTTDAQFRINTPISNGNPIRLRFSEGNDAKAIIESGREIGANDGYLAFKVRSGGATVDEALRITKDGDIGVGTSTPGAMLDIGGSDGLLFDSNANDSFVTANTNNLVLGTTRATAADDSIVFQGTRDTGTTEWMRILGGSGNVGIGTDAPSSKLVVSSGDLEVNGPQADIKVNITGAPIVGSQGSLVFERNGIAMSGVSGATTDEAYEDIFIQADHDNNGVGDILFTDGSSGSPDVNMIIKNNGEVAINRPDPEALFHVSGTVDATDATAVRIDGTMSLASNAYGLWINSFVSPTVPSTAIYKGIRAKIKTGSANSNLTGAVLQGVSGEPLIQGTTVVGGLVGISTTPQLTDTATANYVSSLSISNPAKAAGATINTNYGIYIDDQTAGTVNYSLYSTSDADSYFKGALGIGTNAPRASLDVSAGSVVGRAAVSNGTTVVDFATGNLQYTSSDCDAFDLHNLVDGGQYSFTVRGATSETCTFAAFSDAGITALTVHLPPDHGATTASTHTLYSFMVMGTHLYVAWVPGY